ncbi:histone deacetylase family protein [Arenicella xantha]|uniref:Acetoin utilization deacetylase AcuC-like enzyme n=1 Tax=Arenicella xantha TaxID=644221 RepID=A0A395JSM7_9GAMM|nr:histone deacetylase [Arenicella xantha]RBP51710.1 acetoin utilization deacetylase AcuC-like enzyme [Arenicella xantha]
MSTLLPLVSSPFYSYEFPTRHRFPMQKFRYLVEHLKQQKILSSHNLYRPGRARLDVLQQAHSEQYLNDFIHGNLCDKQLRRLGLPWSPGLVTRTLISPNGTLLTAQLALRHGIACHLAGGTHHAHRDFGSGYCVLNDLAVAALTLVAQKKVQRVLIFDCDVHQGDGTASILQNTPEVTTCSIHCEKNFPARKQVSDIDVGLLPEVSDDAYMQAVCDTLLLAISQTQPDLILYDAGVDIFCDDPLGLLNVSELGIRRRDAFVLQTAMAANIPIATVIGGGYDDDEVALARRHAIVVEEAHRLRSS